MLHDRSGILITFIDVADQETLYAAVLDDGRLVEPTVVSHPLTRRATFVVGFPGETEEHREAPIHYIMRRHRQPADHTELTLKSYSQAVHSA